MRFDTGCSARLNATKMLIDTNTTQGLRMPSLTLNVYKIDHTVSVDNPSIRLLWVLRGLIGLTGKKIGLWD